MCIILLANFNILSYFSLVKKGGALLLGNALLLGTIRYMYWWKNSCNKFGNLTIIYYQRYIREEMSNSQYVVLYLRVPIPYYVYHQLGVNLGPMVFVLIIDPFSRVAGQVDLAMSWVLVFFVDIDSLGCLDAKTIWWHFGILGHFTVWPKFKMAAIKKIDFTISRSVSHLVTIVRTTFMFSWSHNIMLPIFIPLTHFIWFNLIFFQNGRHQNSLNPLQDL